MSDPGINRSQHEAGRGQNALLLRGLAKLLLKQARLSLGGSVVLDSHPSVHNTSPCNLTVYVGIYADHAFAFLLSSSYSGPQSSKLDSRDQSSVCPTDVVPPAISVHFILSFVVRGCP